VRLAIRTGESTPQWFRNDPRASGPVADSEVSTKLQEKVSTTDPDATWTIKSGPAVLGYYDNYLVDTISRVIIVGPCNAGPVQSGNIGRAAYG
jgi:hypothetical protein